MSKTTLVVIAFLTGCGVAIAAPLVIPPAHAQTTQRWETLCIHKGRSNIGERIAGELTAAGNEAGSQGWELVSYAQGGGSTDNSGTMCFKRPAP